MIDRADIYVKGGDGGNGIVSFRREKFVPFGGPNGGDGGGGGNVYLVGEEGISTLLAFRYKKQFKAEAGGNGKIKDMHGKHGGDLYIKVPLGTQVLGKKEDGTTGELITDIVESGQQFLIAKGGRGGNGNARYATSTNQAPRTAENGKPGEEKWLRLDLKLLADVGLAGYPNAGKSTLLSTVSRAKPKIANYPFTTLEPMLGVVEMGQQSFVLADIPGIIEGAHQGKGLGLDFLRHIERTRVLIHVVDGSAEDPYADLKKVESELELYEPTLKDRLRVVAINKIDLPEVKERLPQLEKQFKRISVPVYYISAATGEGVNGLLLKTMELLAQSGKKRLEKGETEEFKVFRPQPLSAKREKKQE